MENRECLKLWEHESEHKPLRRPNTVSNVDKPETMEQQRTQSRSSEGDFRGADINILNTSRLRVEAKEWFPSNYSQPQSHIHAVDSVQNRLRKIKLSDRNPGSNQIFDPSKLMSIMQSLTYDPGQFDNLVGKFMDVLRPHFEDIEVAQCAADMIFELALGEACLRYNSARLCFVIDEHCPLFRSRLHLLCERELNDSRNPQGLTLFLAELYMQLQYEAIYGRSLLTSIKNLLRLRMPDDIKCICQTLKLTGRSLENNHSEILDEIFKELNSLKPTFTTSLLNMFEAIVNSRQSNWGRSNSASNNSTQDQNGYVSNCSDGELILYGPDGQEISSEEQEFLCSNIEDYLADESSDPDDLYDPEPEMDPEIQAAFREFVKMNKG